MYYITTDNGDLVGYERACMVCTTALKADLSQYAEIAKQPADIRALTEQTFPTLAQVYQARLMQERAIRLDPAMIPATERQALILEPFALLAVKVSNKFANSAFSSNAGFVKREIIPILARALRRLRPTQLELQAALTLMMQRKELIGSKIKLADLWAELQLPPPQDPAAPWPVAGRSSVMVGDEAAQRTSAGKLMRVLAYLVAAAMGLLALLTVLPPHTTPSPTGVWVIVVLGLALAYAVYNASTAVQLGASWGRYVGVVLGLLLLPGFPIGTVLGGYLLWVLLLKWGAAPEIA